MMKGKLSAVMCIGLVAGSAFGAGFQLYTEGSAEALGQAGAVSGRTNLVSLAWYNPAALAGAKQAAVMAGAVFASIETDFSTTIPGGNASMSDDWQAIPHLYYVQPISEDWTASLSINAPYGLITEWPAGWAGAALATYSELQTIYITPSVAWRPCTVFSVAAGISVVDAEADLQRTGSRVTGDDMAYGYNISAHFQPLDDWGFGAHYQSSVKMKISGQVDGVAPFPVPAFADLELPSSANFGVANTSIKNLTLGLDFVWTEWSTYDKLVILAPPGAPTVAPKNWDDVWSVRVGAEYALNDSWALRCGYVWDESPIPDTTRAPELPGSDRQMVMAGFGWKSGAVGIDVAYSYLWADKANMGTLYPLPGSFETATHLVGLSGSYRF